MDENNNQEMQETLRQLKEGFDTLTSTLTGVTEGLKKSAEQTGKANERQEKADVERFGYTKDSTGKLKTLADQRNEIEAQYAAQVKKALGEEAGNAKLRHDLITKELGDLAKLVDANGKLNESAIKLRAEQTTSTELLKKQIQTQLDLQKVEVEKQNLQKKEVQDLVKKEAAEKKQSDRQKKSLDDFEKMVKSPGSTFDDISQKNQSLSDISGNLTNSLLKMNEGSIGVTIGLRLLGATADLAGAALKGVTAGFTTMAKSIYDGERGMKVGAKGVTAFTEELNKGVQSFGSFLVGIGSASVALSILAAPFTGGLSLLGLGLGAAAIALGTTAKVAGDFAVTLAKLNELAAEQNDKLYESFQELGKASMTGAGGMTELYKNLQNANMTVKEFDKFRGILQSAGKDMKMFGITAAEGIKTFAETTGTLVKSSLGRTFELMGISQAEQAAHAEKYMAQQTRFGLMQGKTINDLAKGAGKYIEELDKLATLTGATRQEQEEARNAVMAIEELRAAMIDAERQGDTARLEELKRAADMAEQLQAAGLSRQATGTAQYFAAGKAVISQESVEALQTLSGTFEKIEKNIGTNATRTVDAAKEVYEQAGKYASVRKIGGTTEGLYGDSYGKTADFYKRVSPEAIAQAEAAAKKEGKTFDLDAFLLEQRRATDKRTTEQVDLTRDQQQLALKMDQIAFKYTDAAGVNKLAADKFKEAVDELENFLNGKKGTASAPPARAPSVGAPMASTGGGAATGNVNMSRQGKRGAAPAESAGGGRGSVNPKSVGSTGTLSSAELTFDDIVKFTGGTGSRDHFAKLDPSVSDAFQQMAKEYYDATGEKLQINSSFRSIEEQANVNSGGNPKAAPGKSKHNVGRALDLNSFDVQMLQKLDLLSKYGFNTIPNDPPHIEMGARTGGLFDGPSSGYKVELHGREAVVPLPNPNSIINVEDTAVSKKSLASVTPSAAQQTGSSPANTDDLSNIFATMMAMMEDKFDSLINKMGDSNDIQDRILKNSMA
jgi:hypothetical protein